MAKTEKKTLSEWRKLRGLSVQEFADQIGVSRGQAGDYLAGRKEPSVSKALTISAALNVLVEQVEWAAKERPTIADLPPLPPSPNGELTPERLAVAKLWLAAGMTKAQVAEELGVPRATFYYHLQHSAKGTA